jgi:hypothetical protein
MPIELDQKERSSFLKDEWVLLQNQYEDFDKRSLTIKGWVSTGAIAGLAIGFGAAVNHAYIIPIIVGAVTAAFWYLEVYWKMFQYALADRIRIIEAYFRNDPDILIKDPSPFQLYNWWFRTHVQDEPIYPYERSFRPQRIYRRMRKVALQRFVCLPYALIIFISILAAMFLYIKNK